jgi:hypothetical protein
MCSERNAMSAFGYKRTYSGQLVNVRFTPESRHKWLWRGMSACDPKRTFMMPPVASRPCWRNGRSSAESVNKPGRLPCEVRPGAWIAFDI